MNLIKSLLALLVAAGSASVSFAASSTPTVLTPVPKTEEAKRATAETVALDAARDAKKPPAKKAGKGTKAKPKSAKKPKAKAVRAKKSVGK